MPVHNPASTQGISDTLVNPIFQRNIHIHLESFESTDPDHGKDILGILKCFSTVERSLNLYIKSILVNIPLAEFGNHIQIMLIDIGKGNFDMVKFRDRQQIPQQPSCEPNTSRSNKSNLK
ncbi:hypothetical protein D3C85_1083440 [compost metagenome]